jgi:uncharacterized protein (DUF1684 family)
MPDNSNALRQKSNQDSIASINARIQKDETFKTAEDSPIVNKLNFKGLTYFPFQSKWKINFILKKMTKMEPVKINMTDGTEEKMIFFGQISTEIQGQKIQLDLFQHENGNFFLAFKDLTAPKETYGGGRYIDIPAEQLNGNSILVDFNQAYFPYCAYNSTYACPVPPKNNHLTIRIEAGERF